MKAATEQHGGHCWFIVRGEEDQIIFEQKIPRRGETQEFGKIIPPSWVETLDPEEVALITATKDGIRLHPLIVVPAKEEIQTPTYFRNETSHSAYRPGWGRRLRRNLRLALIQQGYRRLFVGYIRIDDRIIQKKGKDAVCRLFRDIKRQLFPAATKLVAYLRQLEWVERVEINSDPHGMPMVTIWLPRYPEDAELTNFYEDKDCPWPINIQIHGLLRDAEFKEVQHILEEIEDYLVVRVRG